MTEKDCEKRRKIKQRQFLANEKKLWKGI